MITTTQLGLLGRERSGKSRGRAKSRRFQPAICGLEERQLLSTFTWDSNAGGAFNNAQNWTDQNGHHGVPGAADTAIIRGAGFTVSIDQATTVGSLTSSAQIAVTSGSLTLDNPDQASSIASLVLDARTSLSVADGSLTLSGNSTLAGTLNAARGTSINFTGGEQVVDAGTVFAGAGNYVINNGSSGSWVVNSPVSAPSTLSVQGGTIDLLATLSIPGQLTWTGGTLAGPGQADVLKGATLDIVTSATSSVRNDAILVNNGDVAWNDAGGNISGHGTINNAGKFTINGQDTGFTQIDGAFNNSGTLILDGGLITLDPLKNTGAIDVVNYGSLTIAGNATLSGVIDAAAGTRVSFFGAVNNQGNYVPGVVTVKPGGVFDGPGFFGVFDSETLAMATNLTISNLQVAGGTVVGSGSLKVTTFLEFDGGEISPSVLSIPVGSTFSIDNAGNDGSYGWVLGAGTVNLAGATDWAVNDTGDLQLGNYTIINNLSSGVFNIETDDAMVGGTFNNLGQISKALAPGGWPGTGTTTILTTLNNAGSVQVNSGTLNLAGPVAQVSGATLVGGSWTVANVAGAGANLTISSSAGITTIGPGASVTLKGPDTSFSNLASLSANAGTFNLLGAQSFVTQGSLSNSGVIDLGAGDRLGVNGNYTQGASATLDLTIAGTSSSNLVSHLTIVGDGYFGGTLNINVPSSFKPVVDDRYTLINYRHARTLFGAIHVSPLVGGEYFSISYQAGDLYLRVY
jgi:hypothetical protein